MIEGVKRNKCSGAFISFHTLYHFFIEGGKRNKCPGNLFLFTPSMICRFRLEKTLRTSERIVAESHAVFPTHLNPTELLPHSETFLYVQTKSSFGNCGLGGPTVSPTVHIIPLCI
jgi:hypothetical protein